MSQGQCRKWLTVFVYLAGVALPSLLAQYGKAPDTYSVTEVNSMFGPANTMEISRDGDRAVVDQNSPREGYPNGFHTRAIYDLRTGKTYSLDLNQTAAACGAGNFSGDWGDPFAMSAGLAKLSPKDAGSGTVNGMAAKALEVVIPGQAGPAKVWVEGKYGLILKLEMGGKTVIEVKKVSFAKPPASVFALPAACSGVSVAPTEAEKIAAATGGSATDFANATMAPASPSGNSCAVLLRVMRAGSMAPVVNGFQVALDKTVDLDHPAGYQMGIGSGGHATFSGGGLKEVTSQLRGGVLRIDDAPLHFDLEMAFGNGGSSSALIHRQCFGPQTVLLYVVKNPEKVSDGTNYWLWVKSGKYATAPAR
jgi:hypothetical protein